MLILFTPVILMCFSALTVLLGSLASVNSFKQDIGQNCTDRGALLREKADLELTCLAIQDRALALRAKYEWTVEEFEVKLDDAKVS